MDGSPLAPGAEVPFLSGAPERTASIAYEQAHPGRVRVALLLEDAYGYVTRSELSTLYESTYRTVRFYADYENRDDGTVAVRVSADSEDFPDLVAVYGSFTVRYIPKNGSPSRTETLSERFTLTDTHTTDEKILSVGGNNSYSGLYITSDRDAVVTSLSPLSSPDGKIVYECSN